MAGVNRMSMMEQVHLAGEDEDDIYGGFNDYSATLDTDVSNTVLCVYISPIRTVYQIYMCRYVIALNALYRDAYLLPKSADLVAVMCCIHHRDAKYPLCRAMLSLLFQFSTKMTLINKPEGRVKMGLFTATSIAD